MVEVGSRRGGVDIGRIARARSSLRALPTCLWSGCMRPTRMLSIRMLSICMLSIGAPSICAQALAATTTAVPQYHHTAWTTQDGAPADIWALAQGREGDLWLGTGTGLFRFDGIQFERYEPPASMPFATRNVTALGMDARGGLWIGFLLGGASVLRDGRFTHYAPAQGAPTGMVLGFAQTVDGTVWAASASGLARFDGRRWHTVGAEWRYPAARADAVFVDARGTLWVATGETLVFLPRGERRFRATGEPLGLFASVTEAPDGTIWVSDGLRGTRAMQGVRDAGPASAAASRPTTRGFAHFAQMQVDRAGTLWGTDRNGGVVRFSTIDRFRNGRSLRVADADAIVRKRDGLSSDKTVPLLQDREGNLWVGTNLGLHRFRYNNVRALQDERLDQQLTYGIAASPADDLLVSSAGGVFRVRDGVLESIAGIGERDSPGVVVSADGTAWVGARHHIHRLRGRTPEQIPPPEGAGSALITLLAANGGNGVLAMHEDVGLFDFDGVRWRAVGAGALDSFNGTALTRAADGAIWVGYPDNRLARWDGRVHRVFSVRDGLSVGTITAIADLPIGLLVAGETGLALLRDGRFRPVRTSSPDALHGITGIVSARGGIWLNGMRGVVRFEPRELLRATAAPGRQADGLSMNGRLFDFADGLPGVAQQATPASTAAVDRHGRLWFATNQGLATIDPARLRDNPIAPTVRVRAVFANERMHPAVAGLRLPKGTREMRIDYTALSLSMPDRVRLRYRLSGVDDHWQDAGNRRQAFYTNLGPGRYRFQVVAANESGVWNMQGDAIEFEIAPRFVETWWFVSLCTFAALAALFALYLLRLRQVAQRVRARLEERHRERERIARELHDTLLQGVQGLVLRFQAIANGIPREAPVRDALERALDRADDLIGEARDRVMDLRDRAQVGTEDLAEAFARLGRDMAEHAPVAFGVVVEGALPELDPLVRDEVYRIGREALANAFQHAGAGRIEVEISCERDALRLRIRDDGRGMDEAVQEARGRPGHWGLSGMVERAESIGGRLHLWSRAGSGTEIELVLPVPPSGRFASGCARLGRRLARWLHRGGA